jgi:hypothetical protein
MAWNRLLFLVCFTVACVLAPGALAATPKPSAFQACLEQHGAPVLKPCQKPSSAQRKKLEAAFAACRKLAPKGRGAAHRSPAFEKYAACMSKHGVTFKQGERPDRNSAAYKAAEKACASLRPAR